jgi:hypothetical protein
MGRNWGSGVAIGGGRRGRKTVVEFLASVHPVPESAMPILQSQLEAFGCRVLVDSGFERPQAGRVCQDMTGVIDSPSGKIRFEYRGSTLKVWLIEDKGHFARALLVGGVKQMIGEAVELAKHTKGKSAVA